MLFSRNPHGERGVLVVPVLPGSTLRSIEPAEARGPASLRASPVAAVLGGTLALVAGAVVVFDRVTAKHALAPRAPAVTAPAPTVSVQQRSPAPTPRQQAGAAALRLAARLPVTLASTALLRSGSTLYVLGGTTDAGRPSDGIWTIDLGTGRVSSAGRFVEPLTNSGAAARNGILYLAGGWTGETAATGVLRWSPGRSSTLVTRLPVAVRSASAAFVDGRLVVVGSSPRRVFEVDVDAGTVTERATAPAGIARAEANLAYLMSAVRGISGSRRGSATPA